MATYLTQDDVNNYGSELVDFAQRAAVHAKAGDVGRVVSFFRSWQREQGQASSGRSQPAARGGASAASGKIYTREEIAKLYDAHHRGVYVGREAEWARQDADIIAAGREGRIRNPVDVHGK
jgi:hypothetical protein